MLTRECVSRENVTGGFAGLYPVLKALEEAGRLRRGYFVAGLGAAQFAIPGADERLRAQQSATDDTVRILSAIDPASPFGAMIDWPGTVAGATRPQRVAGSRVVVCDGLVLGWLSATGETLTTFIGSDRPYGPQAMMLAEAIATLATYRAPILLKRIDDLPADESPLRVAFNVARQSARITRTD